MADYYARLESQLVAATKRGAHRRRWLPFRLPALAVRVELAAVAASALIVAVVVATVLIVGAGRHGSRVAPAVPHGPGGAAVFRNVYPAPLPAAPGALVCESPLRLPGNGRSGHGEARFYARPPTRYELFLTASGLRPIPSRQIYAVWVLPAVRTLSGGYQLMGSATPELLGVVEPSVGPAGRLTVAAVLPRALNGAYKMLLTVQPRSSLSGPDGVVLSGFIDF
jgi:hypothetical protein